MDHTFLPFSQLDSAGLDQLTDLHIDVMQTLLSDLGKALVRRYYQAAQAVPGVIGLCSVDSNGQITGWVMGSPDPAGLNARLRQPLTWFAGQMLRLVLRHPGVLLDLLRSLLSASDANRLCPGQIELTYIGVARSEQGRGLGKALLEAFDMAAFQAGYRSIALSVETDNPAAIHLYMQNGYEIKQTFSEGRFERHRMVCTAPTFSSSPDAMGVPGKT